VATAIRNWQGRDDLMIMIYPFGKVALFIAMPHVTIGIQLATTLYQASAAGVLVSALMEVPTRVAMNTSATPKCPCAKERSGSTIFNMQLLRPAHGQ
jgi:hypothetical protein